MRKNLSTKDTKRHEREQEEGAELLGAPNFRWVFFFLQKNVDRTLIGMTGSTELILRDTLSSP